MSISDEIYALHVKTEENESFSAEDQWKEFVTGPAKAAGLKPPLLVTLDSPYRVVVKPVLEYITEYQRQNPKRHVAVILPELVETHWFYYALHNQRVAALKALLYLRGNRYVAVINVPWYLASRRHRRNSEPPMADGKAEAKVSSVVK